MRRFALFLTLALSAVALAGCAGADAQRAEELLRLSDQALSEAKSFRFAGRLWLVGPDGQKMTIVMSGGGNAKHGGSSFVNMRADGIPGFPEVSVVTRGGTAWIRAGGAWTRTRVPEGQAAGLEQFDFSPYVKDVSVQEGLVIDGEPTAKVTGVLDTTELLEGFLSQLGGLPGTGASLPGVSEAFDDTRVVLYISETSYVPKRALIDMAAKAAGERIEMHMDFAITGVNEPVRVPVPSA
ncbi:MAG: hypothetical protein ACRDON_11175 [Gaiellaceae bacterium]